MTTNKDIPIRLVISCLLIIVLVTVQGKADDDSEPSSNIRRLKKDLLSQYDKFARPVKNSSASVSVSVEIRELVLVELNEAEQKMVLDVIIDITWVDEHLQWEPSNYKEINEMMFEQEEIWNPDIILFDSAPVANNMPWNVTRMVLVANSNGKISWGPPASLNVRCSSSIPSLQPMEERICYVSMASYSYFKHQLDLKVPTREMSTDHLRSNDNPIWIITNVSASLETNYYESFGYSIAIFTISIKRRYDFISDVVRGPRTVAILLTLAMFWLPSTSDKKLNLGCLVLLVLTGIILYFTSTVMVPSLLASTVTPLRITLFTIISALLVEVTIINLSRLSDIVRPPPVLVRILSGMVGRVIGVCSRLEYKEDGGMARLPETEEEEISKPTITIEEEWALVAMALDRIFFIIYAVIFILS